MRWVRKKGESLSAESVFREWMSEQCGGFESERGEAAARVFEVE